MDSLFYIFDLDRMTFVMYLANVGLFAGHPDQVKGMVNDTQDILYFTEAGTAGTSGVRGRNSKGQYFTMLWKVQVMRQEATVLAFSPNRLHKSKLHCKIQVCYLILHAQMDIHFTACLWKYVTITGLLITSYGCKR
jgi:hypothetical protein